MSPGRAVLFDLDDTLYAERRFVVSGLRAVAQTYAASLVDERRLLTMLLTAQRRGRRARTFQDLCAGEGWPPSRVGELVAVFRAHEPRLALPAQSRAALAALAGRWRRAVVTNGRPDVQARKVGALGVGALVDAVIYAAEHGDGGGKPAPEPFLAAARMLGVEPERCVFVGNDLRCDIAGARAVGMRTIRVRRGVDGRATPPPGEEADAVADGVREVPVLASALLDGRDALCA